MSNIDINLGIGSSDYWVGDCYCRSTITYSLDYQVHPGDHLDFGQLTLYPFFADGTPDRGPDQFARVIDPGVQVTWNPPIPLPPVTNSDHGYTAVSYWEADGCFLGDPACTPITAGALPQTFALDYIVPSGMSAVQLSWVGDYTYTPPITQLVQTVPLPSSLILFLPLLTLITIITNVTKRSKTRRNFL